MADSILEEENGCDGCSLHESVMCYEDSETCEIRGGWLKQIENITNKRMVQNDY